MKLSRRREQGFTLLEVLIAATILLIVATGVLGLFSFAVVQNSAAGDHGTRVTEYAQDKMEQLMALSFADVGSDTTQYPTAATGGVGLTAGGSLTVSSPTSGYVDYIDSSGSPTTTAANGSYIREWLVVNDATGQLKTISVRVQKLRETQGTALPYTTLVSQKSSN